MSGMTVKLTFDQLHIALATAAAVLFLRVLWDHWQKKKLRKRLVEAEGKLQASVNGNRENEYRVERYDVLWFPTVVSSPSKKQILQVKPGVPHCLTCVAPLSMKGAQWACAKCGKSFESSLADVMVADSVNAQAVKYFLERNKGYSEAR